jgi:hypothetical protein
MRMPCMYALNTHTCVPCASCVLQVPDLSAGEDPDDAFSRVPYEKGFYFLYYLQVSGRSSHSFCLPKQKRNTCSSIVSQMHFLGPPYSISGRSRQPLYCLCFSLRSDMGCS